MVSLWDKRSPQRREDRKGKKLGLSLRPLRLCGETKYY